MLTIIGNIAYSSLLVVIGIYLNRFLESRAKLITYYGHVAAGRVRINNQTPEVNIHTHSIVISNTGRKPALNVRVKQTGLLIKFLDKYPEILNFLDKELCQGESVSPLELADRALNEFDLDLDHLDKRLLTPPTKKTADEQTADAFATEKSQEQKATMPVTEIPQETQQDTITPINSSTVSVMVMLRNGEPLKLKHDEYTTGFQTLGRLANEKIQQPLVTMSQIKDAVLKTKTADSTETRPAPAASAETGILPKPSCSGGLRK